MSDCFNKSSLAADNLAGAVVTEASLKSVADVHTGPVECGLCRLEFRVTDFVAALGVVCFGNFDGVGCCHIVITYYQSFNYCQASLGTA